MNCCYKNTIDSIRKVMYFVNIYIGIMIIDCKLPSLGRDIFSDWCINGMA